MNRHDFRLRIRALFQKRRLDVELEEEIRTHLELQTRKHIQMGMEADQAQQLTHHDFGGLESTKEACRDERRIGWISDFMQDLAYGCRMFRRSPGFAALIVLMLALGIGANIATFSVLDAILLKLLPVREPASLFRTVGASGGAYDLGGGGSYRVVQLMRDRTRALADVMAYEAAERRPISIGHSDTERLMQQTVSANYFQVLGVQPALGRLISSGDDQKPGEHPVAVISERLWKQKFDKNPEAIGSELKFGGHAFTIIGIAPAGFFGVEVGKIVDVWTPVSMAPLENLRNDHMFWLRTMARLHPGVTIAQAAAPMQAVRNEVMLEDVRQHAPPGTPKQVIDRFLAGTRIKGVPAGGGISSLRGQYQQPLKIMLAVVALVLLIACSNVANLLIAKGAARRREMAIRLSLGAGRTRLLKQLITESILLAAISAVAGLLFAHWATPLLIRLLTPASEPAQLMTGIDLRLIIFTCVLALLTVLICGALPAVRLTRADVRSALNTGTRLAGTGSARLKQILAASQIAMSLVLVIGAVLSTRTLVNLVSSYVGFRPASVLVTRIVLDRPPEEKTAFSAWSELLRRVRALPGVEAASLSSASLFSGNIPLGGLRTNAAKPLATDPVAGELFVSAGYFQTLGIPFVEGRDFEQHDNASGRTSSAIVNQAFSRKFFGNENPLGRKLTKMANAPLWTEIVGVVKDAKFASLRETAPPIVYIPYGRINDWIPPQANAGLSMSLQVQGSHSLTVFPSDLRRDASPQFTIGEISRQQQLIDDTLVRERLLASVASLFGVLSLFLAALGLYGIMSYSVVQRRQEIGIRMALGAAPKSIVRLMLRDSVQIITVGTLAGILLAALGTRLAEALLYGLAPHDPATFMTASFVLAGVSLAAAFIPAHRAAGTDPMTSLRNE